jgi:hypothetical protein
MIDIIVALSEKIGIFTGRLKWNIEVQELLQDNNGKTFNLVD